MTSLMTLNQHKIENYVMIASLKSESVGKVINRIPGSWFLISSLPGSALRKLIRWQASPCQSLPGNLDIKRHSPRPSILYNVVPL